MLVVFEIQILYFVKFHQIRKTEKQSYFDYTLSKIVFIYEENERKTKQ